jgi:hypothetical protein
LICPAIFSLSAAQSNPPRFEANAAAHVPIIAWQSSHATRPTCRAIASLPSPLTARFG